MLVEVQIIFGIVYDDVIAQQVEKRQQTISKKEQRRRFK